MESIVSKWISRGIGFAVVLVATCFFDIGPQSALADFSAPSCDGPTFPSTPIDDVLLFAIDQERTIIRRDGEGCPEAGQSCDTKAYLISGDTVVAAQARGPFRCVAFVGARGQTTGWIRQDALSPADMSATGDWTGAWSRARGTASLTIRRHGTHYQADMLATAHAADPDNVRTGVASGEMTIDGTKATFSDGGTAADDLCKVELLRLGPFLIANDGGTPDANSACDGMGVTLNGIYRRADRKP